MCGIAGIIHLQGRPLIAESDGHMLAAMAAAMRHRGPDDCRQVLWQNVGFVFTRLSIIDIAGGQQPFETSDGRVVAMVNGEIYNHRALRQHELAGVSLTSQSDCEVIPYLYLQRELDLFGPVNGMFAMALLDRTRRRVLLGRDRTGVKPLFYCLVDAGQTLVFASELKALFAHPLVPRRFDWQAALARYSDQDTQPREFSSGFLGIERVAAAGLLDISLDTGALRRSLYWQLPARAETPPGQDPASYIAEYGSLLEDSVRLRLMADARFGVFLSGGVDSAAITAMAARQASFPTFSVISQSTIGSGDAAASRFLAEHLGLPNHQVFFDLEHIRIDADDWRRLLWSCEMPGVTAEQLYKYFLHAYAKQIYPDLKVILLGQGSDEFNGGYTDWTLDTQAGVSSKVPDRWRAMGRFFDSLDTTAAAIRTGYMGDYADLIDRGVIDQAFVRQGSAAQPERTIWDQYYGYYRQNLDYHLWHEDRTAAAHSIENRVPFLDYRLLVCVSQVPEQHQRHLFTDKHILRAAVAKWLPTQIAQRPKGPFFYGKDQHHTFRLVYSILTGNGGELIEQALRGSQRSAGPLHPERFRQYVTEVGRDPALPELTRMMGLVNMGVLADLAAEGKPPPPRRGSLPVVEIRPKEFSALCGGAVTALAATNRVPMAPGSAAGIGAEVSDQSVPGFAPGVRLIEQPVASGQWVLAAAESLGAVIDSPGWLQFLRRIDGKRSIAAIMLSGTFNRSRALRGLRTAIDQGLVVIETQDPSI